MSYNEVIKNIERGKIEPLYFFYGEEGFLIDEAVKKIASMVVEPSNRDFNLDILRGSETSYAEIINKVQTLPFMGEKRVVIVKDIDEMKGAEAEKFIEYCSNPSPSTCLIFTTNKIDGRSKLHTTLSKNGITIQFNRLNKRDTSNWITKKVNEAGYRIDTGAREYLFEVVGNNLQRLKNEMEKIFTYKGDNKNIKTDDIKILVEDTKVETIFAFTDSIGTKDINKAIKLLDKMFNQGEMPEKIISMIARQFRLILLTKVYREKGVASLEIPAKAGFKPFLLNGYMSQAAKYTLREIKDNFYKVQMADIKIKSSNISKRIIIERLIFDLCSNSLYPVTPRMSHPLGWV